MRPFLSLTLVVLLSGCTSYELTRVRNDLAYQLPEAEIGEGYSVSFGRLSVGLTRLLVGASTDDETASVALREVKRVQFGRYDLHGSVDTGALVMPARLQRYTERGWSHLASFRLDGEAGWVIYRDRGETITDVFAVVVQPEELILVKLSGDLSALVLNVMEQQRTRIFDYPDMEVAADSTEALMTEG